jgi:acetyl-CoA carboxylase biotin carboxyl carrier protein
MNENDLTEMEIERENGKIRMSKKNQFFPQDFQMPVFSPAPGQVSPNDVSSDAENVQEEGVEEIVSPMVGVFYRAPSPDADPFVEVGDTISEDQVLCIVEAMKVMNEIKSEISGEIVKILVENGKQVEYNQPLFLVKKI